MLLQVICQLINTLYLAWNPPMCIKTIVLIICFIDLNPLFINIIPKSIKFGKIGSSFVFHYYRSLVSVSYVNLTYEA